MTRGSVIGFGWLLAALPAIAADSDYADALGRVLRDPGNPNEAFAYGAAAAEAGDPAGLVAALERLLVFEPALANIRFELGLVYLRLGAPHLADAYLRDALDDPAVPQEVRVRGLELVDEAEQARRRWRFSGFGSLAVRHDSNANSGPDGTVQFVTSIGEVEGRLRGEDTGQADTSVAATLAGTARYDLGTQAGHLLEIPALLYVERYQVQTQLDLGYANLAPRLRFDLGRAAGIPTELVVGTFFAYLVRDGEDYLGEAGGSIELELRPTERLLWRAGISAKAQDFRDTEDTPLNDQRDGGLYAAFAGAVRDLGPATRISADLLVARKTADADFEAYREYGARAEVRRLFRAPGVSTESFWEAVLLSSFSVVDYDDLDLAIDLDTAQRDERTRVEGQLIVPVGDNGSLLTRLGYYQNASNFAIRDYDNVYVAVEIGRRF